MASNIIRREVSERLGEYEGEEEGRSKMGTKARFSCAKGSYIAHSWEKGARSNIGSS